jgi:hypothetical protein
VAHLLTILFFFGLLAGLATLLERIFRDNLGVIGAALRGPQAARSKPSAPARTSLVVH